MESCKIGTVLAQGCLSLDSSLVSLGVDVSRDSLAICELYADGSQKFREIRNNTTSINRLAAKLERMAYAGKTVMESTGRHHMLLAIVLTERGLDARVINPLLAKKYATASIRKVKTDKRDSAILAEIGIRENDLPERFMLDRKGITLRKRMRMISTLSKQLQNLNSCLNEHQKTLASLGEKLSPMEQDICEEVRQFGKKKARLEKELEKDICADEQNALRADRYTSIPGVSPLVAALAVLIFSDEHSQSAKQWIAFIGLDVSVRQSGTWNGKGHLTKRGNDYLRTRFYSAAWGATMHNEKFREYYDHLRARGRKHKEALVIIARKIISIMFSLNRHNSDYDGQVPVFSLQDSRA